MTPKKPPRKIPALDLLAQHQSIRSEVEAAVRAVFDRQDFILGEEVVMFEQEMARLHGCVHAVGCASGSDALLLSLLALGIGPGDGVVVPAFTFFATAGAVARLGARPVFVDIDPRTFCVSAAGVEQALREEGAARIKAILPVHLYGQCADMEALMGLASRYGVAVIEDCAQAVRAAFRGQAAGSFGRTGCFSFYPTKNLGGAGDGGMITTNDAELAGRLRQLRNHGSADKRVFPAVGINSRLDTLQAAVLRVKLRHIEEWTRARQQRAAAYRQALDDAGLTLPEQTYPSAEAPIVLPYESPLGSAREAEHVYHQFTVRARHRDRLAEFLETQGVGTAVYYPVPLHRQPAFAPPAGPPPGGEAPEADRAAGEVLSLPLYPELTESQQAYVVEKIRSFYVTADQ